MYNKQHVYEPSDKHLVLKSFIFTLFLSNIKLNRMWAATFYWKLFSLVFLDAVSIKKIDFKIVWACGSKSLKVNVKENYKFPFRDL